MPEAAMAGENPYTAPPSAAGQVLTDQRRSTQNMVAAEPAKPSVSSTVRLTCGPASKVTGVSSTPGSSSEVFHIRLTPRGAFIAVVTRCGRLPCATDSALYRMNQANRSMSVGSPTCILDAGLTHSRQVTANAPARYRASTSQLAHRLPLCGRGS